jgi:hypothetical protein
MNLRKSEIREHRDCALESAELWQRIPDAPVDRMALVGPGFVDEHLTPRARG